MPPVQETQGELLFSTLQIQAPCSVTIRLVEQGLEKPWTFLPTEISNFCSDLPNGLTGSDRSVPLPTDALLHEGIFLQAEKKELQRLRNKPYFTFMITEEAIATLGLNLSTKLHQVKLMEMHRLEKVAQGETIILHLCPPLQQSLAGAQGGRGRREAEQIMAFIYFPHVNWKTSPFLS